MCIAPLQDDSDSLLVCAAALLVAGMDAECRPFNPKSAGGAVEKWLIECEAAMRDTVKSVIKESFDAYTRTPRETWMVQWPGQVVLAGEQNAGQLLRSVRLGDILP